MGGLKNRDSTATAKRAVVDVAHAKSLKGSTASAWVEDTAVHCVLHGACS